MHVEEPGFRGIAEGREAIAQLGGLALQREKTKRLLICAACLFFAIAAVVVVFAPPEKEKLAYVLGVALVVMALEPSGAAQFRFKLPGVVVSTDGLSDHNASISGNSMRARK